MPEIGERVKVKTNHGWPRRGYFIGRVTDGPLWETTDGYGNRHYVGEDQLLEPPPLKQKAKP